MIYGRGTVWVICSERYDPKFYTGSYGQFMWDNDIRKAKFILNKSSAAGICGGIKTAYSDYGLTKEDVYHTSVIEIELVQHWPEKHTE